MSNSFLNFGGDSVGLESLTTGTFAANLATIQDQSLVPGLPVAANGSKRLVGRLLGPADLNFVPLENPHTGDLTLTGGELIADNVVSSGLDLNLFVATVGNDVIALQTKTTDISYVAGTTTIANTLLATTIRTNSILDHLTASELINIDADSIDLFTGQATLNGNDLATSVTVAAALDTIALTSAGGSESLVVDGTGPVLSMKGLSAGTGGISLTGAASDITIDNTMTGASLGGAVSIFANKMGSTLNYRGVSAGAGISLSSDANSLTINSSNPTVPSLVSAGGVGLVSDGIGPSLGILGLQGGPGITVSPGAGVLVIASTNAVNATLASAGGTESLVADGVGPALATKGLTAGSAISLTPSAGDVTIDVAAPTLARITNVETTTQYQSAAASETTFSSAVRVNANLGVGGLSAPANAQTTPFLGNSTTALDVSYGGVWTVTGTGKYITSVGISAVDWPADSSLVNRTFNIWQDGVPGAPFASYSVPRTILVDGVYILAIASLAVPAGTYRHAVDVLTAAGPLAFHRYQGNIAVSMNPLLTSTGGAAGVGLGVYPSTLAITNNSFSTGQFTIVNTITGTLSVSGSVVVADTGANAVIINPTVYAGRMYIGGGGRPVNSGGFVQTSSVLVANTTVETDLIGAGVGTLALQPNIATVGATTTVSIYGNMDTFNATQILTLRTYAGPTAATLINTRVLTLPALADGGYHFETYISIQSLGVAGAAIYALKIVFNDNTAQIVNVDAILLDTTAVNQFMVKAQWTTANAGNRISCIACNTVNQWY
jgi:hypothetical protein